MKIYKTADIKMTPEVFHSADHKKVVANFLGISPKDIFDLKIFKKSVDARHKNNVCYVVSFTFCSENSFSNPKITQAPERNDVFEKLKPRTSNKKIVVVGSGAAGLFCGLYLAKCGFCPTVIEQGKNVADRQKDVDKFWKSGVLDLSSNIQFGLGGAGTFSDGKLTTSANNELVFSVLNQFVRYGAPDDILTNGMPHIGTDNLKIAVQNIADEIVSCGGKVLFETKLVDFDVSTNKIESVTLKNKEKVFVEKADVLVLAIGHSARDTFELLHQKGVEMRQKPFSVGVRVEHLQETINKGCYGQNYDKRLPAATYKMAAHFGDRSAYTFCMCPGGFVVNASSEHGGVVTNGMSYFARDGVNANSALLVNVDPSDFESDSPLAGIEFQRKIEHAAFVQGGSDYSAPAQNVTDFLKGKPSVCFYETKPTIMPKALPCDLIECLPEFVTKTLKKALPEFGKRIEGFDKSGVLTGVETRSSCPLKVVRNECFQSNIEGIFPIGEGSGYAGGIVTAAVDGLRCAMKIAETL